MNDQKPITPPLFRACASNIIACTEENLDVRNTQHIAHLYDRTTRQTLDLSTLPTDPDDVRHALDHAKALLNTARLSADAQSYLTALSERLSKSV